MENNYKIKNAMTIQQYERYLVERGQAESGGFLSIPKQVFLMPISNDAKILYGILFGFVKYGHAKCTNEYLMEQLSCTKKSLYKYLDELVANNCISVSIEKGYKRQITPLITTSVSLMSREQLELEYQRYIEDILSLPGVEHACNVPQAVNDFFNSL